jgi:hypothetical protein
MRHAVLGCLTPDTSVALEGVVAKVEKRPRDGVVEDYSCEVRVTST